MDQISFSNYAVNGLNPIVNVDPGGDDWTVGTDEATKKDVYSIPEKKSNAKYIKINEDGVVSLNWEQHHTEEYKNSVLNKDPGLSLINDLINDDKEFYYSTSEDFQSPGVKEPIASFIKNFKDEPVGMKIWQNYRESYVQKNKWLDVSKNQLLKGQEVNGENTIFYKNASTATYGKGFDNIYRPTLLPRAGFDGQVHIADGKITNKYTNQFGQTLIRNLKFRR